MNFDHQFDNDANIILKIWLNNLLRKILFQSEFEPRIL